MLDFRFKQIKFAAGFTLLELLVAITVVGILSAVAITVLDPPSFYGRGRDAQRRSDLQAVKAALEQYYLDNGRLYPSVGSFNLSTLSDYLSSSDVFTDPAGGSYAYDVSADQKCFQLRADQFENGSCTVCGGSLTCQNAQAGWTCSCP